LKKALKEESELARNSLSYLYDEKNPEGFIK
jgi:hypothetical protein